MNNYLIAETACSHNGSVKRLKKLVKNAIISGFDAIQLQIWKKESMVTPDHSDFKVLEKVEINMERWVIEQLI